MSEEVAADFISAWHADTARLEHTYDPTMKHDACGVGLLASLSGQPPQSTSEPSAIAVFDFGCETA